MKIFALLWTISFLLMIYPVMKLDHRLTVKKRRPEVSWPTQEFIDSFRTLGYELKLAEGSIKTFNKTMEEFNERT